MGMKLPGAFTKEHNERTMRGAASAKLDDRITHPQPTPEINSEA